MAIVTTRALILRHIPFQESSLIVRLFTESQGKVAVIAKGARRLKSTFRGYLEPLNLAEVIFYYKATREIQTLSKVSPLKNYFYGEVDVNAPIYGTAVIECLEKFVPEHHPDENLFRLVTEVLDRLQDRFSNRAVVFIAFLLQLATALGYQPAFDTCGQCHRLLGEAFYDSTSGGFVCEKCGQSLIAPPKLNRASLTFLRQITAGASADDIAFTNSSVSQEDLARLIVQYIARHLDVNPKLKSLEMLIGMENR